MPPVAVAVAFAVEAVVFGDVVDDVAYSTDPSRLFITDIVCAIRLSGKKKGKEKKNTNNQIEI